jgi:hypothetical protein
MMDALGDELIGFTGNDKDFRSRVLTPVLQRHLRGIPDSYAPAIRVSVSSDGKEVTIADATRFYLNVDPLNPAYIPSYRRNLIYIREARWQLALLLGKVNNTSNKDYNRFLDDHDTLMEGLMKQVDGDGMGQGGEDTSTPPLFSAKEVEVIVNEGLHTWFARELAAVVCTCICLPHLLISIDCTARTSRRCLGQAASQKSPCLWSLAFNQTPPF